MMTVTADPAVVVADVAAVAASPYTRKKGLSRKFSQLRKGQPFLFR